MKSVRGSNFLLPWLRSLSLVLLGGVVLLSLASCSGKKGSDVESSFLGGIIVSGTKSEITISKSTLQPSETSVVTLSLMDQNGSPYVSPTALTISFSLSGGTTQGTFSTVVDNGDGTYTSTFTATQAGSASRIMTTVKGASVEGPSIRVLAGTLSLSNSLVTVSSGSVVSGNTVTVTLTARDTNNLSMGGGSTVSFAKSGGTSTGTFSATTDNGDGTYSATFTGVVSGTATTITCQIDGQSVTSTLPTVTVMPGSATQFTLSGISSPLTAGSSQSLTVTAKDGSGNTATGYTGTVSFSTTSTLKTLPANYTFTSGSGQDNGVHTFTGILLKTSGSQSVTATDTVTSSITGSISSLTVNPASTTAFAVSGFTSPATSATSYSFTVTAQDTYGNTTPSYTGTVALTSSAATKSLPTNYTFTSGSGLDNGTHTFSGSITTAGTQSITATDTVTASITGSQSSIAVYPVVSFSAATQDAAINQGTATVTVSLNTPAGTGQTVTVPVTVNASSTAVATTDYTLSSTSLSFAPGSSSQTITVTLVDQLTPATSNATLVFDLGTLTNGVAGSTTSQTLTIRQPTLDLNFAGLYDPATQMSQAPYNAITFTRASTATYTDCDGLIKIAATNVPRVDCDPVTGQPKGLLIEEARTNMIKYSADLNNWSITTVTKTKTGTSPDGSVANLFADNSATSGHGINLNGTTITAGSTYTFSVFLKYNGRRYVELISDNGVGNGVVTNFDLFGGTIANSMINGTATAGTALMIAYPNGWYRCIQTFTLSGTDTNLRNSVVFVTSSTAQWYPSFAGTTSISTYIWGAQVEAGTFATSYVPTPGNAAVTRSGDVVQITPISSWFTSSAGTIAADFYSISGSQFAANQNVVEIDDSTFNNRHTLTKLTTNAAFWRVSTGGVSQVGTTSTSTFSGSTEGRITNAYQANDYVQTTSNSTSEVNTASSGTLPTGLTSAWLGSYGSGAQLDNSLKRFSFYQQRLPNTSLLYLSNLSNSFRTYAPKVNLTRSSQTVIDTQGTVYVTAALSEPATATLTVPYTVGGTAVSGTNYSGLASGNLSFAAGESRKTLSISLLDDGGSTNPTITVTLGTGTGYSLGTNTVHTVTIQRPALDLNFAGIYDPATQFAQAPFSSLTFTRASTASFVDVTGLISYAASNVPRIDYDPSTHQPNGFLIEEARTNLVQYSGNIANAAWAGGSSRAANAALAPDGSMTATLYTETNGGMGNGLASQTLTYAATTTYTQSIYVKPSPNGSKRYLAVMFANSVYGTYFGTILDPTNGTVTLTDSGVTTKVTALPNGWYRFAATATTTTGGSARANWRISSASNDIYGNQTGDNLSGLLVWGGQLEAGAFATSYIPTTSASATRAADAYSTTTLTWLNTSSGSVLTQGTTLYSIATTNFWPMWWSLWKNINDRMELYINQGTSNEYFTITTAGSAVNVTNSTISQGAVLNQAVTYNANDFETTANGAYSSASSTLTVPTGLTTFSLGSRTGSLYFLNGTENRLTYYSSRLTTTQLRILSSPTTYTPRPVTPTVTLTKASQSVLQSEGTGYFVAALNEPARSTITVPYTISGTAVSGTDYSGLSSGTLTFTAGQSRALVSFTVSTTANTGRTVTMTLGTATGATAGSITAETIYLVNATTGLTLTSSTITNNGTTVTFSGTCGPGMTITISGTQSGTVTCGAGGTWSWTSTSIVLDGVYSFSFTQSDGIQSGSSLSGTYNRDATAPTAVASLTDGNTTTSTSQSPTMTWAATTDPTVNSYTSGVSYYMLALGTSAGGTDVVNWTNVGNVTTYQFTGLSLTNGTMYYGSIKAVDSAGNASSVTQGDGFAVVTDTPTLAFDFTSGSTRLTNTNASYPAMIQFTNLSGASVASPMYYNSSGVLTAAAKNMFLNSQTIGTGGWGLANASATLNAATAPNGTTTASYIAEDSSNNQHAVYQNLTVTTGVPYTISIYLKGSGRTIQLMSNGYGGSAGGIFDPAAGTVSGGWGSSAATITSVGSGWYRCTITFTPTSTSGNIWAKIYNSNWTYQGDGTSGVYLWGGQAELGTTATSYIYTNAAAAYGPRFDYDPTQANCPSNVCSVRGLLIEEARTNSIKSSGDLANSTYWANAATVSTANSATAPDGAATAATITDSDNTTLKTIYEIATPSDNQTWTASVYIKKDTDTTRFPNLQMSFTGATTVSKSVYLNTQTGALSSTSAAGTYGVQDVGLYWRLWVNATNNASGNTNANFVLFPAAATTIGSANGAATGSIIAWGAQLELGASPSSYIPTTTTALTRNADIASVPVSSWMTDGQGTFYSSFVLPQLGTVNQFIFSLADAGNNIVRAYLNSGGNYYQVYAGGAAQFLASRSSYTANSTIKSALTYSTSFSASLNGSTLTTGTGTAPTGMTQLYIGQVGTNSFYLNGWLKTLNYYNSNLSNSATQMITK